MTEALHTKYRPEAFEHVVGHKAIIKSLSGVIKRNESQAFLFAGPSGVGKTTLARICARELGCEPAMIQDINAAKYTGVDDMRAVADQLLYRPFGASGVRAIVIDECHRLSKQAWESLLKPIEEPPPGNYWFLCTTEPGKVPKTIQTRCTAFTLNAVSDKELGTLYDEVCELEKLKIPADVGDLIIREAGGSPRQMLVNLVTCQGATTKKEAAELLRSADESEATIELCRFLANRNKGSWQKAMAIVAKMETESAESVRIVVRNYFATCLKGAKSDGEAIAFLTIMDAFAESYNPSEGFAPLLVSIGRVVFAGD